MDDDSSGGAVLDDDAPDMENDHDDELTEGSTDLVEPDPAKGDVPGTRVPQLADGLDTESGP